MSEEPRSFRKAVEEEIRRIAAERKPHNVRLCASCQKPVYVDQIPNPNLRAALQKTPANKVYCGNCSGTGQPDVEIRGQHRAPWAD